MKTGKNFTASQRKTLMRNGVSQQTIDEYLLQKQEFVEEGSKHLSLNGSKKPKWTLIHRTTEETMSVIIER